MPYSFDVVNKIAQSIAVDQRIVYTTPKSFLELLAYTRRYYTENAKRVAPPLTPSNGLQKLNDTATFGTTTSRRS